jgi:CSLREA domain-containing protein
VRASSSAATILVNTRDSGTGGPDCTLRDAITAANEDKVTGGCVAGVGADTIVLEAGATYVLTAVDGQNGLPVIASNIEIDGNGARIERSREAPAFRLLYIGPTGVLTLRGLTLANGLTGNYPKNHS